jgi:hypothetical protein
VGRYPRLSAHPTNNRKQENIKKGDCVEKFTQAIWLNAGTPENLQVLVRFMRAVKILKCGQSAGKARKRTLRDYTPDPSPSFSKLQLGEDIVRSAWRHAGVPNVKVHVHEH